jgi:hypothetical protein
MEINTRINARRNDLIFRSAVLRAVVGVYDGEFSAKEMWTSASYVVPL